ncbi:sigma-70 family RNA polymerase sigma factor [Catalinimonas sp. 4WD22]|uniref:RNA polymerase sigma factor n=1 Tax=Catalinimonas locisalis TaxID=3133978 RepID=UPI003101686D
MEQLSTQELLKGIRQHDARVLKQIYEEFYPMIRHLVISNRGNEEEAKDIFQETLMVIYEKLRDGSLNFQCSLKTYCYAIARNTWLMVLRRKKRDGGMLKDTESTDDLGDKLIEDMTYARRRVVFQEHMDKLGQDCQQILKAFFQGKSLKEIAEAMKFSPAYAKKRKYICQQKLISSIEQDTLFNELNEH